MLMLAWSRPGPPCEVGCRHAALPGEAKSDAHMHSLHAGMHNKGVIDTLYANPRKDHMFGVLETALGALYIACGYVAA